MKKGVFISSSTSIPSPVEELGQLSKMMMENFSGTL
jgi:hypothetical protein